MHPVHIGKIRWSPGDRDWGGNGCDTDFPWKGPASVLDKYRCDLPVNMKQISFSCNNQYEISLCQCLWMSFYCSFWLEHYLQFLIMPFTSWMWHWHTVGLGWSFPPHVIWQLLSLWRICHKMNRQPWKLLLKAAGSWVKAREYLWSKRTGYNAYASKLNKSSSSHSHTVNRVRAHQNPLLSSC